MSSVNEECLLMHSVQELSIRTPDIQEKKGCIRKKGDTQTDRHE